MPGAGKLKDRYRFDQREPDANGDRLGAFVDGFSRAAQTQYLRGSETVTAQRLAGHQPVIITVRSDSETRAITTGFRAVDIRAGGIFNVTAVSPARDDPGFLDILATSGGAAG